MHKMQSGGWPYSKVSTRDSENLESTVSSSSSSSCSCLSCKCRRLSLVEPENDRRRNARTSVNGRCVFLSLKTGSVNSRAATQRGNPPFQCFGCTRPPTHKLDPLHPGVVLATLLPYTSSRKHEIPYAK